MNPGVRGAAPDQAEDDDDGCRVERQMNKVALITLWVEPTAHQIVKYTFDNVGFDFLPGRSLVRVDTVRASMQMGEPFPGVWLPRAIDGRGSIHARERHLHHSVRSGVPQLPTGGREGEAAMTYAAAVLALLVVLAPPAQAQEPSAVETVVDIRVHGNHTTPDAEMHPHRGSLDRNAAFAVSHHRRGGASPAERPVQEHRGPQAVPVHRGRERHPAHHPRRGAGRASRRASRGPVCSGG